MFLDILSAIIGISMLAGIVFVVFLAAGAGLEYGKRGASSDIESASKSKPSASQTGAVKSAQKTPSVKPQDIKRLTPEQQARHRANAAKQQAQAEYLARLKKRAKG